MLETIGYDAATAASFAPWDAADASVGRVTRVDRGVLTVLTESGPHRVSVGGALLGHVAQDPAGTPCLGDWVVVRRWPDRRETVEHVLPRRTAFPQGYGNPTHGPVLAANVDLVAVVVDRDAAGARPAELSRLLDLAIASGARPVVVLTGGEPDSPDGPASTVVEAAAARGVEIVPVDPDSGSSLTRVRALVGGRLTLALIGTSGRVTASLARALVGADHIGAGRSRRGLALLPGGGALLDLRRPAAPSLDGRTSSGGAR